MASRKLNFGAILVSAIFILFANLQVLGEEFVSLEEESSKERRFHFRIGVQGRGNFNFINKTNTAGIPFSVGIDFSAEHLLDNDVSENVTTSIGLSIGALYHTKAKFEQKWAYNVNEERLTTTLEPSMFTLPVEIYLKQELGKSLSLKFVGGIDIYWATTNYSYSEIISGEVIPHQVEIKDSGIGWHVGLRPEVSLSKTFSLVFAIKFFSLGLNGFPPDENGNIGEMRRFMGKDNNGIVYGPEPIRHRPPGTPINGCEVTVGGSIGIGNQ
ncbi:MAG: hypothetical protein JSV88_17950 [Candidatus Aminicenantes bacterium]|nr:MAG: hypothetical protein JSV88_17950 [Candidatus Aminicenantes bacterium]